MTTTLENLRADRDARAAKEDGPKFKGLPDRWWDAHKFRCLNGHVSTTLLKSEELGSVCIECHGPALLTHPEDSEGE